MTLGPDGDDLPPPDAPHQHRSLLDGPGRPRHRALRLIMTAAGVTAGLCLVVGMVALVAAAEQTAHRKASAAPTIGTGKRAGGSQLTPPPRTGGNHGPGPGPGASSGPRISPAGNFSSGRTLASFQGSGTGEPGPFQIGAPGTWGMRWSYSCPSGHLGDFVIGETHSSIALAVTVNAHGTAAHGMYWVLDDAGRHSLVVVSTCRWQLAVILPGN